ncbi:class II aldolase/adducin family protein [Pseudooctadecabacter jejudonensis]|uniref:Short chain dehydrogenase n=1 Tax=Pseudooctadecabacter jejudonensis TaxID=1391910 RepID=A0A1Y5SKJ5_9RHOB|nr:class II aldolase/adducin family protein [Pseudooctadecabacter jejudonensis]SLN41198.1 short chain dehydrogenase [Pseudooctadecabacter jejudonensis]
MTIDTSILTDDFRALSARLGQDPLQVQGPGGNTSIKRGNTMWIKASGTELADAERQDIFVAVDRAAAVAEAREQAGDGSCKSTVLDPAISLRPSIETTFHAALDWPVVAHTHSVATLAHAISPDGRKVAIEKLDGLPFVMVPYAKPGLPLTREILAKATPQTQVFILQNHGLIGCGTDVREVSEIINEVESRLALPKTESLYKVPTMPAPAGLHWADESWMALDEAITTWLAGGSYYPDHVVFLGPGLPLADHDGTPPAILQPGVGILLRDDATSSQRAMLKCLSDLFLRLPDGWNVEAIGEAAEAELLNWDAEKYRQALAAQT